MDGGFNSPDSKGFLRALWLIGVSIAHALYHRRRCPGLGSLCSTLLTRDVRGHVYISVNVTSHSLSMMYIFILEIIGDGHRRSVL